MQKLQFCHLGAGMLPVLSSMHLPQRLSLSLGQRTAGMHPMRLRFSGCLRHVRDPRPRRMEFPCEGVHEVVLTSLIDSVCRVLGM